jgi:hypothetical protein
MSHSFDAFHAAGLTAQMLAAEDGHREAQQYAVKWVTAHQVREHTPCALRRWSGEFVIRIGLRLRGATSVVGVEIQSATH